MAPVPPQSPEPIYGNRPPSSPVPFYVSPLVNLILRVFAFIFLLMSLIIITTNTIRVLIVYDNTISKIRFNDVKAYRYMLFTVVIGLVYMLLQIAFNVYHVTMGKPISPALGMFDFYADKIISYTLATGAAATFGATIDLIDVNESLNKFWNKANAAASLLLIAFVFSAVSSVFSSLALRRQH